MKIKTKINILGMSKVRQQSARKLKLGTFEIFLQDMQNMREVAFVLDQEMGKTFKEYWPL